ncbi:hypothetical protein ACTXT7_015331 [Hymenolepis weldensis]
MSLPLRQVITRRGEPLCTLCLSPSLSGVRATKPHPITLGLTTRYSNHTIAVNSVNRLLLKDRSPTCLSKVALDQMLTHRSPHYPEK